MSTTRQQQKHEFLQQAGWQNASVAFLSGDASFRSYDRVMCEGGSQSAVLMDAPPAKEPLAPFLQLTEFLRAMGYSAPKILAKDEDRGFLLLEDLGDALYSRHLKAQPAQEVSLYMAAADLLIDLHHYSDAKPNLAAYDETLLVDEALLFMDWFFAAQFGEQVARAKRASFAKCWREMLASVPYLPEVVVLRDYHADNLLWLPERSDLAKVGLLDYQDAVIGSPAYDLVSLLEDARRDIAPETVMTVKNHYLQQMQWDVDAFNTCYALIGAQRNMKIIGIFSRLAMRDKKPHYLSMLPRVWQHLALDMQHAICRPMAKWLDRNVPQELRGIPNSLSSQSVSAKHAANG